MNNKPIDIAPYLNESTRNDPEVQSKSRYNNGGGDDNMNKNPYVTHQELELSNERLLRHIDQRFNDIDKRFDNIDLKFKEVDLKFEKVNTKFEKQKVWFLTTAISIVAATCTIVGFLLKFIR